MLCTSVVHVNVLGERLASVGFESGPVPMRALAVAHTVSSAVCSSRSSSQSDTCTVGTAALELLLLDAIAPVLVAEVVAAIAAAFGVARLEHIPGGRRDRRSARSAAAICILMVFKSKHRAVLVLALLALASASAPVSA